MLGGRPIKHERYDTTFNFLQYAEQDYSQGKSHFFTTSTVVKEAARVMEKAVNDLLASKLPKLWKKGKREKDGFGRGFVMNCLPTSLNGAEGSFESILLMPRRLFADAKSYCEAVPSD